MADEEQEMELEALEAIYMDDFQIVSNDVPRTCTIILHPEGVIDEETTTMTVQMTVEMPPAYPEEPPMITLESIRGVTDDECVQLVATLQEMIPDATEPKATENLGMQMIFTLASHVQAWMVEAQQEEEDRRLIPTEEEKQETIKRQGTLLTREIFAEWKRNFDAEQAELAPDTIKSSKKTGRQLFEEDASLFDDKDVFVEDTSLFTEEDLEDLEDI